MSRSIFRKPSLKKSFKARTTGRMKREIKRALIPGYGKKGMGLITNPKRSLYNAVYHRTSIDTLKPLKAGYNAASRVSDNSSNTSNSDSNKTPNTKKSSSNNRLLTLKNTDTGVIKQIPSGCSWTTLFFGFFVPLFRNDAKYFFIFLFWELLGIFTLGISTVIILIRGCLHYNQWYVNSLIKKGFQPINFKSNEITEYKKMNLNLLNKLSSIFNSQKNKDEIETLIASNSRLKLDNEKLKIENEIKLTARQLKPFELEKIINQKNDELQQLVSKLSTQKNNIKKADTQLAVLKQNIIDVSEEAMYEDYGLYKPHYDFSNSSTYKGQLAAVRSNQKEMIRNYTAGEVFNPMKLDGSAAKGKSLQKKNIKQLVRCFNSESEAAVNKVTKSNIDMIEKRITKSFNQLNKLNEPNGVRLTTAYLDSKLDEAHIALEYALKKANEKEILKEQLQREREEKKLQKEIADEKAKYQKDENQFEQAKQLLQNKIDSSSTEVESVSLTNKLKQLEDKIQEVQNKKQKLLDRAENPTAGYVYIISNIGSFGKNVYKIGVTRRLDPMDRINELSNASVPFKFDVHALIFSSQAFQLENELHKYFADKRVNKVNARKEYFRITMEDIKKVLSMHKELTFDFHDVPSASEYRDSQLIH